MKAVENPEIVIGLVGRLGTETRKVAEEVANSITRYGYSSTTIQVSDLIKDAFPEEEVPDKRDGRITKLIDLGNRYCSINKSKFALAKLAMIRIAKLRSEITGAVDKPIARHAFIINQFKRPDEIFLFREVYGERFFLISCHASERARVENIANSLLSDHAEDPDLEKWKQVSTDLCRRDEDESDVTWGQRVSDAFPLADFFLDASKKFRPSMDRFWDGVFGNPEITPSFDENGAHLASVAALKSNDLSRQVGAAIISPEGEIIAFGCNEVPRPGGGIYGVEDDDDDRDFVRGGDVNSVYKKQMIIDIIKRLSREGWIKNSIDVDNIEEIIRNHIEKKTGFLSKSKIMAGLEFGRAMHAEMNAIADAARFGRSTKGAILYCTTFPCHNCAKHIVGAGISKVIFKEPYQKSKAIELYPKAIELDYAGNQFVGFNQFVGIGTRQYRRVFRKSGLKDETGKLRKFKPINAQPLKDTYSLSYLDLEASVISEKSYETETIKD